MKANKIQYSLNSRFRDIRFHLIRGRGHLARYLYDRFVWHWYPRLKVVRRFPEHVDVEITNICNMSCPMCYRRLERFDKMEKGFMDYGLFKKIIDECSVSGVYSVRLSIRGEPLLHPQIMDFIRYSKGKGIREVSFLTNALLLDDKISVDLIESGLDWMTVSFDGLGSTYEKIRRPAKYEEALNRLKAFSNMRRRKKSTKPALKVQAIWPAIEDDPEGFNKVFSGIADMVSFNPLVAFGSCPEQREDYICPAVWQRLVIYWDGAVPQCINDPFGDNIVGDIRKEAIREVWLGAGMKEVRDKILRGNRLSLVPCSVCYYGAKKDMMTIKMAHGKILAGMVSANLSRHGDYKGGGDG